MKSFAITAENGLKRADEIREEQRLKEKEKEILEQERLAKEKALKIKLQAKTNRKNYGTGYNEGRLVDLDLTTPSGLDIKDYNVILGDTNLSSISEALVKCEEEVGVNGLFLLSLAALESGWGNSNLSINKNNITGFQAYDNAIHKAKTFTNYSECILHTAKYLKENYLSEDGKYFSGYTIKDVNKRYSSSDTWYKKITNIMNKSLEKLGKRR